MCLEVITAVIGKNKVKKSSTLSKVLCLTNDKVCLYFQIIVLKVLRAFQVSRDHFQCFWENKVKQRKLSPLFSKQRQSDIPRYDFMDF